jgi:hypothetical protein
VLSVTGATPCLEPSSYISNRVVSPLLPDQFALSDNSSPSLCALKSSVNDPDGGGLSKEKEQCPGISFCKTESTNSCFVLTFDTSMDSLSSKTLFLSVSDTISFISDLKSPNSKSRTVSIFTILA